MDNTYLQLQFEETLSNRVRHRLPTTLLVLAGGAVGIAATEWLGQDGHPVIALLAGVVAVLILIGRWGLAHWNAPAAAAHPALFAAIMALQTLALAGMLFSVDATCTLWSLLLGLTAASVMLSHRWLVLTLGVLTVSWLATTFSLPPVRGWLKFEIALIGVWIAAWNWHELRWRRAIDELIERRPPRGTTTVVSGQSPPLSVVSSFAPLAGTGTVDDDFPAPTFPAGTGNAPSLRIFQPQ